MIVDAHPHIYSSDKVRYPTIDDPWESGEPAEVADLRVRMDAAGVERAVFIQTSTYYGWDNRYVMDSARDNAAWATGVVTLSPDDPAHLDVLSDAVENHGVRGLRGTTDREGKIGSANVRRLWSRARDLGIVVNCMVLDDLGHFSSRDFDVTAQQADSHYQAQSENFIFSIDVEIHYSYLFILVLLFSCGERSSLVAHPVDCPHCEPECKAHYCAGPQLAHWTVQVQPISHRSTWC